MLTIHGNTGNFIYHPLPKNSVSAHGASHHAWAPGPHQLNPALRTQPSNVPHQAEYSDFALLTDFKNKSSTKLSCM